MFISPEILDSKEIPGGVKHLLRILLDFSNKRGECFPGQARIALRMGKSIRSVRRYIRLAEELRFISVRHRWLNTSVYTLLCLVPPKVIHKEDKVSNKLKPLKNKSTLSKTNGREIKICLEDSKGVLGESVFKRNKNWLYKIIKTAGYDLYQECLHWLRNAMLMADCDGKPIHSPSGLLTYQIRKFVKI